MVAIITPNEVEAQILTSIAVDSEASAEAQRFFARSVGQVVITRGKRDVYAHDGTRGRLIPAWPVHALDTTGAGDAFNGGFAAALAEGRDLWAACDFANTLASLSVQKLGTAPSMPAREEIDRALRQ